MKKLAAGIVAAVALVAGAIGLNSISSSKATTGSIVISSASQCGANTCWTCKNEVKLDLLNVNVDNNVDRKDAVKFAPGCTGKIDRIEITQRSGDGIKIAEGTEDLVIGGGFIKCLDKAPVVHQDGIQAMGGKNIAFNNLNIDCGRANESLIDSNFFVKKAGSSTEPPQNVVCDNCALGGNTAHTVNIEESIDSGVKNSQICIGKYPRLTFTVGPDAVNPVQANNRIASC